MVVERGVCDTIFYDKHYSNFVTIGQNESASNIKQGIKTFRPGVLSGQNVKSPAVTNMRYWIESFKVYIRDEELLSELRHFERKQNRTWGAEVGFHDDLVMSMVWALNVLHKNIVEKYYIVETKDANGTPTKIQNKFKYALDNKVEDSVVEEVRDYTGIPVCVFGRATYAINPQPATPKGDQFDIFMFDNWRPLN